MIHPDGTQIAEIVKGVLYDERDFQHELGTVAIEGDGLTLEYGGVTYQVIPQERRLASPSPRDLDDIAQTHRLQVGAGGSGTQSR